jgi:hypothetical protein
MEFSQRFERNKKTTDTCITEMELSCHASEKLQERARRVVRVHFHAMPRTGKIPSPKIDQRLPEAERGTLD